MKVVPENRRSVVGDTRVSSGAHATLWERSNSPNGEVSDEGSWRPVRRWNFVLQSDDGGRSHLPVVSASSLEQLHESFEATGAVKLEQGGHAGIGETNDAAAVFGNLISRMSKAHQRYSTGEVRAAARAVMATRTRSAEPGSADGDGDHDTDDALSLWPEGSHQQGLDVSVCEAAGVSDGADPIVGFTRLRRPTSLGDGTGPSCRFVGLVMCPPTPGGRAAARRLATATAVMFLDEVFYRGAVAAQTTAEIVDLLGLYSASLTIVPHAYSTKGADLQDSVCDTIDNKLRAWRSLEPLAESDTRVVRRGRPVDVFGHFFAEMSERGGPLSSAHWRVTRRLNHGLEEELAGEKFTPPHLPTCSLAGLCLARTLLDARRSVCLDVDAESADAAIAAIVSLMDQNCEGLSPREKMIVRDALLEQAVSLVRADNAAKPAIHVEDGEEVVNILVGSMHQLTQRLAFFVRFKSPVDMRCDGHAPVRFLFLIFGPPGLHEESAAAGAALMAVVADEDLTKGLTNATTAGAFVQKFEAFLENLTLMPHTKLGGAKKPRASKGGGSFRLPAKASLLEGSASFRAGELAAALSASPKPTPRRLDRARSFHQTNKSASLLRDIHSQRSIDQEIAVNMYEHLSGPEATDNWFNQTPTKEKPSARKQRARVTMLARTLDLATLHHVQQLEPQSPRKAPRAGRLAGADGEAAEASLSSPAALRWAAADVWSTLAVAACAVMVLVSIVLWIGPMLHGHKVPAHGHTLHMHDTAGTVNGIVAVSTAAPHLHFLDASDPHDVFDVKVVAQQLGLGALGGGGGGHRRQRRRRASAEAEDALAPVKIEVMLFAETANATQACLTTPLSTVLMADGEAEMLEVVLLSETRCKDVQLRDSSELYFEVSTDSVAPVALAFQVDPLGPTAKYRVAAAGTLLVLVYVFIVFDVIHRTLCAMVGAFLTLLLLSTYNTQVTMKAALAWVDVGTVALLFGMMVIVNLVSTTGLFEWLAIRALERSNADLKRLLTLLCVATAVLSAFLDNVTTMLLLAPVTIELCKLMEIGPVPILVSEVLLSNIGGTATMIGDPPNIIIGNMLADEIGFVDFVVNLAPCIAFIVPVIIVFLHWHYRDVLSISPKALDIPGLKLKYPIRSPVLLCKSGIVLGSVLLLFFTHPLHHVDTSWVACLGALALMIIASPHELHHVFAHVEWDSLLFFAALFIMIEAMAMMGLIRAIGEVISSIIALAPPAARLRVAIVTVLGVSAVVSGFFDNIPYTATMVPVLKILAQDEALDLPLKPLVWSLALGACLGGNMTLVGASANLVTAGAAEHAGFRLGFVEFMMVGGKVVAISVSIAMVYCVVLYDVIGFEG